MCPWVVGSLQNQPAQEPVLQRKIPMACQTLSRAGFKQPKMSTNRCFEKLRSKGRQFEEKTPPRSEFWWLRSKARVGKTETWHFRMKSLEGGNNSQMREKTFVGKGRKTTTGTCERICFWPKHNLLAQHADFCNGSPRRRLMYFKFMLKKMLKRVLHACLKF